MKSENVNTNGRYKNKALRLNKISNHNEMTRHFVVSKGLYFLILLLTIIFEQAKRNEKATAS